MKTTSQRMNCMWRIQNSPVVSKKRKASKKFQSSKKKRKCHKDLEDVKNDFHKEEKEGCELHPEDKKKKKKKESGVKSKPKAESTPSTSEKNDDILEHSPSLKRSGQLQENGIGCNNTTQIPDGTIKVPSRIARRKKAKRQWLWEKAKAEKNEVHEMQSPEEDEQENDTLASSLQDAVQNKKSEADNEINVIVEDDKIVPIVIRPGHIRFEPLEEGFTHLDCGVSTVWLWGSNFSTERRALPSPNYVFLIVDPRTAEEVEVELKKKSTFVCSCLSNKVG
ncbi:hypothetical protein Vadar_017287 [Vaccinium darrowii]|uniref:Uncharacterized protein n=1 Tax=Vaccinium darrowii TaxID=229202 RepID=A0ACB7YNH4_9ERIC|nr:hypothetical protein Vadar_017287 [Vaccinium darrowii]